MDAKDSLPKLRPSRRAVAALLVGAPAVLSAQSPAASPGRPLKLGVIGCGWYGGVDLQAAWRVGGVACTAICDVDSAQADLFAALVEKEQGQKPQVYKDYRELIEKSGVDALLLTTPPHWHALPFLAACAKKIPVYCEKPLAYDIRENQAMVAAWQQSGNIVQIGFQRRQGDSYREVKELIARGDAGQIVQVDAQIHYQAGTPSPEPVAPPATLDWDLWCGPSPKLPYSVARGHKSWRLEQATGHGHLVDWGIHLIDATRVILGETTPRTIDAFGGIYKYQGLITTPDTLTANFAFARCPVTWRHRLWGASENDPATNNGIFFFGDKATVFVTDAFYKVMPRDKNKPGFEKRATITGNAMGTAQMKEFLDAVRGQGPAPSCTPADAALSTTTVQLGMVAYESGTRVQWDAAKWNVGNNAAAARLLQREYRGPWKHPFRKQS